MSQSKKKSAFDGWTRLARRISIVVRILLFRREGRLTLVGFALLALLTVGPYVAWRFVGPHVASAGDYQLTADRVELIPKPESVGWIRRDVKQEALRDAGLDQRASILDDDLNERLAKAVALHPWISQVRKVTKHYPARVEIEVAYRQPAAIVVLGSDTWWPVDAEGVVLPRDDFSPYEARRYPQIAEIPGGPYGPTGTRWGDVRVGGAAKIAAAFGERWKKLSLARIAPLVVGTGLEGEEEYAFLLYTERGTRIYWGHGPENSVANEPPTDQKVAKLQEYADRHGSLDAPDGTRDLDLRGGGVTPIPRTAKAPRAIGPLR